MRESVKKRVLEHYKRTVQRIAWRIRRVQGIERTPEQIVRAVGAEFPSKATGFAIGEELIELAQDPGPGLLAFIERIREPEIEDGVAEALGED